MRTICIIFLSLMGLCLQAQTYNGAGGNNNARLTETLPLDKSLIECIYSYKIHDPERDEDRESFKILEIGNDFSKFSSYGMYRVDSIVKHKYPNGVTVKEYFNLDKIYKPSTEFLIKDLKSGSLKFYDRVFMDRYVYEEPIPDIKWELGSDTKEICGYNCNQASASFRGRNWTAWYSDQFPVNNGPWKFGNLPGLILKLEDNDHEHIFEAIGIRRSDNEFGMKKFNFQKTTREKFNKTLNYYKLKPGKFMSGSPLAPTDKNGKSTVPNNRMFYNPIEKE